ncbi:uncharacterized protein LOC126457862 [Schistocerca serialis cubense]|uniref:uncharacterized protein LOC126457862 n=1 Tax=Schistocerca serialis cubense TaxID=2023355 RepID=UPI00214E65C3|nr:uncharacterized protein LOC126457862 [Schistocerca serialis cubense]
MGECKLATLASVVIPDNERRKNEEDWTQQWIKLCSARTGTSNMQYSKLRFEDPDSFLNFTRIDTEVFMKLLRIIENDVCRQDVNMRESMKQRDRFQPQLVSG